MKNIGLYLKSRIKTVILLVLILVVELVVFFLYSVPNAPVVYSFELLVFVFALATVLDYITFLRKHKNLMHSIESENVYSVELSETKDQLELDYQELITKLINEKYQVNEDRVKAMTELRDYYAIWGHQIKTPIAAMDVLLQTQSEDEPVDPGELRRQLFKIEFYVDAVMNYLRLEDLSSDFSFDDYEVGKIVKNAVKKFAPQFIGKHISVNLDNLEIYVKTDEKWLGFMVEQLLSNAIKYSKDGGKIEIFMQKESGNHSGNILVIKDYGIGIAPEDLPRIFERGYTGYNGRMDKKSSGIGLYLCKKTADKLDIDLKIESLLGEGTSVLIDLTQNHQEHE